MADDPILQAISGQSSGGAVAVAEHEEIDPILAAIKGPAKVPSGPPATIQSVFGAPQNPAISNPEQAAASIQQPSLPLAPPQNLYADLTQVPRNVFTNQLQLPPAPQAPPPPSPLDATLQYQQNANEQADALVSKLSTGSKKLPLPYVGPDGKPHTMPLEDFQKLAADYLNDPSQPKSRAAAFIAGSASDAVSTLNDIFFSPVGMASAVTGLTAARALQRAGKQGVNALKLMQDYQAMKVAGATEAELLQQKQLVDQAIVAAAKAQKTVGTAGKALSAAGAGFALQGADQVAQGVKSKDYSKVLSGLAGIILGGSEVARPTDFSSAVQANTAKFAKENFQPEDVTAKRTPTVAREATPEAPAAAPPQLPGPEPVGAGEALAPESPGTLKAQTDALEKGTNKVVYFPKGQENIPEAPEGATVTKVAGNKPGAGTYYHDESITPTQIRQAVKNGTYGQLLGNVQTKEEAVGGGKPAAVVVRGADGAEHQSALVDANNPAAVAAQASELTKKFPESKISVEPAEKVVSERQAPTAAPTPKTRETAVSSPTPGKQEEYQTGIDKIMDAITGKASVQPKQQAAEPTGPSREPMPVTVTTKEELYRELPRILASHKQAIQSIESKVAVKQPVTVDEVKALDALSDKVEEAHAATQVREPNASAASVTEGEKPARAESAVSAQAPTRAPGSEAAKPTETAATVKSGDQLKMRGGMRRRSILSELPLTGAPTTVPGKVEEPKTFKDEENGTEATVTPTPRGFAVTLKDTDSGETLPQTRIFKDEAEATEYAQKLSPPAQNLTSESKIEAEKEPVNVKPVGAGREESLEAAPPENVRGSGEERNARPASAESSGQREERVQPVSGERNGPARGLERSETESPVPAGRGRSAAPGRKSNQFTGSNQSGNDYRITEADHIGEGSPREKFTANADAIRTLKAIESEGRSATPAEQSKLVRYSGWGWTGNALFNDYNREWERQRKELQGLLTDEEYAAARKSTVNAHYTSPEVVKAMWDAVSRLGFEGGRVLEPSAGIGHFLGLMPSDLATNSRKTAVELDPISGRILKQLYQNADVRIHGLEALQGSNNFYDLAISNVPFGDFKVHDPAYNKLKLSIHNYFIAKMLDRVRPGGIVAAITSHHTLDAVDGSVRKVFKDRGDLLGAIRLPDTVFKGNAGTEVVTDMLFFRKRAAGEQPRGEAFEKLANVAKGIDINEYFKSHPEMVLGKHSLTGSMYGSDSYTVKPGVQSVAEGLPVAIESLPKDAMTQWEAPESVTTKAAEEGIPDYGEVRPNGLTLRNGKVLYRSIFGMNELENYPRKSIPVLKGMLQVRDAVRELFQAEARGEDAADLVDLRGRLNRFYDAFVQKHGYFHQPSIQKAMDEDPDLPLLLSLEKWDAKKKTAIKADAFFRQTVSPRKPVEHVENAKEGLQVSLAEKGKLDFAHIAKLTGKTPEQLQADLGAQGLIFHSPEGHWETTDRYLSGNVRKKLAEAEGAAKVDPAFQKNVDALRAVHPRELEAGDIIARGGVRLGATWVSPKDVESFIDSQILEMPSYRSDTHVTHIQSEAIWKIHSRYARDNAGANQKWGTARANAVDIIDGALNMKEPTVYDRVGEQSVINQEATLAAREKLEKIQSHFEKWLFSEADRSDRLVKTYNELYNSTVARKFDGSHLTFPGMTTDVQFRGAQKDMVWRAVSGNNESAYHQVGLGKTYEGIAIAMEKRRLGLSKKPTIVVPNHMVNQWENDWRKLYPGANILAIQKDEFTAAKRKEFMNRIATGDWDGVIVAHRSFQFIPVRYETLKAMIDEQMETVEEHLREMKKASGKRDPTVKQLEKIKLRLEAKLKDAAAEHLKDAAALHFEELGIDSLIVDEAHAYKNLLLTTKMGQVAGIPNSNSARAFDMLVKTQHIAKLNNGKNVHFLTGTPISNTMAEIYNMMRYLDPQRLKDMGVEHFDAWAATFGKVISSFEVSPSDPSRFRVSKRFAEFTNLPELIQSFTNTGDVKFTHEVEGLVRPAVKRVNHVVKPTERVKAYVKDLGRRADRLKGIGGPKPEPTEDNMLKITGDGRKAALDYRLVNPGTPDEPGTKINKAVDEIARIHQETAATKRTQVVFLDMGTPGARGKVTTGFNAYADMKRKLIAKGIPEGEIKFIHDAAKDAQKQVLFDKVNDGEVRIIFGSTEKMGVGTNIQRRLIALHHLDAPWRPSDIEQREGRIERQGNENKEIEIHTYVTEATFDAYMWQMIERKAKFISQAMKNEAGALRAQDIDGRALSAGEVKALATGNPLVMEKIKTDMELGKLQRLAASHLAEQISNRRKLGELPARIATTQDSIEKLEAAIKLRDKNIPKDFAMKVGKGEYKERADAGQAINAEVEKNRGGGPVKIGRYAGFDLWVDGSGNAFLSDGNLSYNVSTNPDNPLGTVQSMETSLRNIEKRIGNLRTHIEEAELEQRQRTAELDKPFDKQAEMESLEARSKEIDSKLKVNEADLQAEGSKEGVEYTEDGRVVKATEKPAEDEDVSDAIRKAASGELAGAFLPFEILSRLITRAVRATFGKSTSRPQPTPPPAAPPAQGVPRTPPGATKERAGNIRLDKLNAPEDVINEIRRMAKENEAEFNDQRRGKVPFSKTRMDAQKMVEEGLFTEKDLQNMKKGTALNAEELLAARGILIESAKRVRAAAKIVGENPSVEATLEFQRQLSRHAGIQKAVSGAVAEAGRALSQQRMIANALGKTDKSAHEKVLEALGGQDLSDEAARRLAQIPADDYVALNNFIKSQKYWSSSQKIEAYWIANVLSSPRTPIKKALGDVSLGAAETANRFVSAAIDPVLAAIQGRPREFFMRDAQAAVAAYLSAIPEATRKGAYIMAHGFDSDTALNLEAPFKYEFRGGLKNPWNYPGRLLSAVTKWFQVVGFQGEIHSLAVRKALKEGFRGKAMRNRAAELIQHPTDAMIDEAIKQAQFQTYTESPDMLSRALMTLRDKVTLPKGVPVIGGMRPLRFVIPFVQIPYNLAKNAVRYSPFGALRLNDFDVAKKPEASKILGRALLGTAVMGFLAYLASRGLLTGAPPSSPAERDEYYRSGKQPYSVKIGNHWVSYRLAGSFALTAAAVAAYHEKFSKDGDMSKMDQLAAVSSAMGQAFMDESFLRGIKNVIDAMNDPQRFAGRWASGMLGGFVPMESALRTLNDSLDPTVRNPQDMYERILAGLPIVSKNVRAKLDTLGRPSTKEGTSGLRALVPGGVAEAKARSSIDAELDRLHGLGLKNIGFSGKSVTIDSYKVPLDPDERDQMQKLRGKYLQAYLGELFKSAEYKAMTDEDKVQEAESAIRDAEKDSREQMITAVLERRIKNLSVHSGPPMRPPGSFAPSPVQ